MVLLHIYSQNFDDFIQNLNNLSASNDVNMHFQAPIEERYSSVP